MKYKFIYGTIESICGEIIIDMPDIRDAIDFFSSQKKSMIILQIIAIKKK